MLLPNAPFPFKSGISDAVPNIGTRLINAARGLLRPRALEENSRTFPSPVRDHLALARAREALRRNDLVEAERMLLSLDRTGEADPAFFNLMGILHECQGQKCKARAFYARAIAADSRYEPAQQNLRRLYELAVFGKTREFAALGDEFQLDHESCCDADRRRSAARQI